MFFTIIFFSRTSEFRTLQIKIIFQNSKNLAIAVNIYLIKVANLTFYLSALYMLRNVLLVKLTKLYTVNYMYSLSALYMLQYVPIVTYSCKLLYSKKKKKQEKDPYSGMGKNTKVMPQKTPLSIFSLGKGRESLCLQTLLEKLSKRALSALPPARKNILIQTLCGRCTPKLTKISSLFRKFLTFPVTEGYAI